MYIDIAKNIYFYKQVFKLLLAVFNDYKNNLLQAIKKLNIRSLVERSTYFSLFSFPLSLCLSPSLKRQAQLLLSFRYFFN